MDKQLRVETEGGLIQGEILKSELNGEPYYSFKGVPYARPPVGSLRFQPPDERVEKWDGVKQCTEERNKCLQLDVFGDDPHIYAGSEDCLYLNVFFPVAKSLRPVMVFLHGGGFTFGSKNADFFGPDFLVTKGVVLVVINYRINIFGFLNLGIKECPGNAGLWDQRAALTWIQRNIKKFSGDPNNVTIFGESAGSTSAHHHLLSPVSKGLFHKAILQSGSALDPWAYMDIKLCIDRAFRVGEHLGCKTTDVKELHEFLLNAPAKALAAAIFPILTPEECTGFTLPFVPSKEIVGAFQDRMIPDDPRMFLRDPIKVPVLCGLNSAEGQIFHIDKPDELPQILKNVEPALDKRFPEHLKRLSKDQTSLEEAKSKVRQFYTRGATSDSDLASNFAHFFGDMMFVREHHLTLKGYLSSPMPEPFYLYLYDFESNEKIFKIWDSLPDCCKGSGACHADELLSLFRWKSVCHPKFYSEARRGVIQNITTIWTNFAKFGNPNGNLKINWEPISPNKISHCKITEKLKIEPGFINEERMKFWDDLHSSLSKRSKF